MYVMLSCLFVVHDHVCMYVMHVCHVCCMYDVCYVCMLCMSCCMLTGSLFSMKKTEDSCIAVSEETAAVNWR